MWFYTQWVKILSLFIIIYFFNKWFVIRVQAQTQMQHFLKWFGLIPPRVCKWFDSSNDCVTNGIQVSAKFHFNMSRHLWCIDVYQSYGFLFSRKEKRGSCRGVKLSPQRDGGFHRHKNAVQYLYMYFWFIYYFIYHLFYCAVLRLFFFPSRPWNSSSHALHHG